MEKFDSQLQTVSSRHCCQFIHALAALINFNQDKNYFFIFCQKKKEEVQASQAPDEEGWVLVTRHGRGKATPREKTIGEKKVTAKGKKKVTYPNTKITKR